LNFLDDGQGMTQGKIATSHFLSACCLLTQSHFMLHLNMLSFHVLAVRE